MTYVLTIPEPTPSLNAFYHKHWRIEHTAKKRWFNMLSIAAMRAGATVATSKRRLTVVRYGVRKLDVDNFLGGLKGCIDCLRKLNLLIDDDEDGMELVAHQLRPAPKQKAFTSLTLEDM